jgi:hypothetical protein
MNTQKAESVRVRQRERERERERKRERERGGGREKIESKMCVQKIIICAKSFFLRADKK